MHKRRGRALSLNVVAVSMVLGAAIIYGLMYFTVYGLIERISRERLNELADFAAEKVSLTFSDNEDILQNIANSLDEIEIVDDEALVKLVNKFVPKKGADRISAIFPDDRVVTALGTLSRSDLSFEKMKADIERGDSFSRRDQSRLYTNQTIIRQYMPVYRDGEIAVILYAIYDCDRMSDFMLQNIFENRSNMQIIDTRDGKVVADGFFNKVTDADENTIDGSQLKDGGRLKLSRLLKGGRGDYIFKNDLVGGQYMFLSYAPTEFSEYVVALYVPENVAFGATRQYRNFIYALGAIEFFALVLFLIWVKNRNRMDVEHALEDRKRYLELNKLRKGRGFDTSKDEIENIFAAIADGYDTLVHIDFETGKLRSYRTGRAYAIPEDTWNAIGDYHTLIREYARVKAIPEDQEMLIDSISFKSVWEDLSKGRHHTVRFRSGDELKPELIEVKFVHLEEQGDEHCAIVGFKYLHEE